MFVDFRGLVSPGDRDTVDTVAGKGCLSFGRVFCLRKEAGLDPTDAAARSPGDDDHRAKLAEFVSFEDTR